MQNFVENFIAVRFVGRIFYFCCEIQLVIERKSAMEILNSRLIYVFTDLILPLIVGYFLHRKHLLSDKTTNMMIKFNVVVVYTVLSILSFWVLPISWDLVWLLPFGMMYVFLPGTIAELTFAKRHKSLLNRGAYVMSAMLSNIGTLGGVCAFILYNETGFAYTQIVGACQNILVVLVCFPLAQYYYNQHVSAAQKNESHLNFREMFLSWNQLSLLGIAAGLILNVQGVPRPEILSDLFQSLVHFAAWVALLPVGFLINFSHTKYYYSRVWDLAVLRFVIVPAVMYFVSRLLFTDTILLNTLFICALAPTAINAVLTSRLYKLNVDLAVTSFIMTTAMFLLIIFPAFFFLAK